MGLEALYRHAPSFLQPLAVAGMGAYLRWQRLGGEFPALLAEAEAAAFAGTEELRVLRERRWAERIGSAVAAVAAYGRRPLSLADLERLPILTKAQVRQRPERFRRPGLPFWARVPTHTSGSTGAGLRFLVTRHVLRRSYAYAWRFRRWHGIGLDEPCAVFGGRSIVPADQAGPPWWRANPVGRTVLYSQYHLRPETVRRYLEDLRARRLRWIHGYPSVLGLLARLGLEAGLAGGAEVRWITVSSENLLEPQRRDIERMFGVRPRQLYGTTECVALACECPEGRLHIDEDYSVVELVPIPEVAGAFRVVGTTLDNDAFPLLRYDVGDVVRLADEQGCPCGRSGRILSSIDGRQEDYLVLADGSRLGRCDIFFKDATRVAEAQIVQRRAGEAILRVVRGQGYGAADEASLRAEIRERVGERLEVRCEYVERLPRTRAGKLRLVVSELPEGASSAAAASLEGRHPDE